MDPSVAMESSIVDFTAWIFLFSKVIGGIFFLIILVIMKNFLSKGFSWAISEVLLNFADNDLRIRMCKYLANGDIIIDRLEQMDALNKKVEGKLK